MGGLEIGFEQSSSFLYLSVSLTKDFRRTDHSPGPLSSSSSLRRLVRCGNDEDEESVPVARLTML
jgi:hypothetical protein